MLKKHQGFFITGTDTGVGKTFVSSLLCEVFKNKVDLCYFKPVQTGYEQDDDTLTVVKTADLKEGQWTSPSYRLRAPISPDRAAEKEGVEISLDKIEKDFSLLKEKFCIVEGAGGLEVPITPHLRMSGLIKKFDLPVVVVASTRLGTINHTLLTVQRAQQLGLKVIGVILNGPEDAGLQDVLVREGVKVILNLPQVSSPEDFQKVCAIVEKAVDEGVFEFPSSKNLAESDQKNVWHPFTQYGFDNQFPTINSGEGSLLQLSTGEKIIDGISSWWVNLHGHSQPQIAEAISRQAHTLEHAIFSGYTHEPAVQLCETLLHVLKNVNASWSK
ncbi:dethiobiotin synthase, partial [bacterium]|nr:dethiobiotin synthase [bacterium]